jgi:NSS family neurotransmitter:Na+ symporter
MPETQGREEWGSKIGFIFAAAGSAVGLGNIWRFPYVVGENGGAAFVFLYLLCVIFIGLPYMYGELALGRAARRNPVGTFKSLKPGSPWIVVGGFGVLTGLGILSFYGVIAGWTFGYIFKTLFQAGGDYESFVARPMLQLGLFAFFILLTVLVVHGGITKGIERCSKILMPLLILLILGLIIYANTLEGAGRGLTWYLKPDFSKITPKVVLNAMTQAFFSMSLGMGLMITYGSYISKKDNLITSGFFVGLFDTLIAILAGLMIFPALFAMQRDLGEGGPGLVFQVLPGMFDQMPGGILFGTLFFTLISIAALTSTISLLEVPVAYFIDERRVRRKVAVWLVGGLAFFLGIPSVLSQGAVPFLGNISLLPEDLIGGTDFLAHMIFIFGVCALALGAFLASIFIGWVWGVDKATAEIMSGCPGFKKWAPVWRFFIRYICPLMILAIFIGLFWN